MRNPFPYIKICTACKQEFNTDSTKKMLCNACRNDRQNIQKNKKYSMHFKLIKKVIMQRDNNQCQFCKRHVRLIVHHIDCDKGNNTIDNLITLCSPCHNSLHGKYSNQKLKRNDINKLKPKGFIEGKYGMRPIYS